MTPSSSSPEPSPDRADLPRRQEERRDYQAPRLWHHGPLTELTGTGAPANTPFDGPNGPDSGYQS